jgi:hypothetical protein
MTGEGLARAQKRYLAAIETVALVRKPALLVLQVNIAASPGTRNHPGLLVKEKCQGGSPGVRPGRQALVALLLIQELAAIGRDAPSSLDTEITALGEPDFSECVACVVERFCSVSVFTHVCDDVRHRLGVVSASEQAQDLNRLGRPQSLAEISGNLLTSSIFCMRQSHRTLRLVGNRSAGGSRTKAAGDLFEKKIARNR